MRGRAVRTPERRAEEVSAALDCKAEEPPCKSEARLVKHLVNLA